MKIKCAVALFSALLLLPSTFIKAQSPKITSLIIEPLYPYRNSVTLSGENISSTPISGEFNPGWERCRPCNVGTEIPLSINRTRDNFNPIEIRGATNLVIGSDSYDWAVGWLEMSYNVPNARIIKGDQRRRPYFARESTANVRIRLWRSDNEFPNASPILDQTLAMNCTAYLSLTRYRNFAANNSWLYDAKSYRWICGVVG